MIPTGFDYMKAASLNDALKQLAAGDNVKVVAGGHSLIPLLRFRLAQPGRLVDIGHLPDLRGIVEARKGLRIGAATTYRELLESPLVRERFPVMVDVIEGIGDRQVRNRGTIGGGLAHADPAADMPPLMLALDASFTLRSKRGKRAVKAREFFTGPFMTAMADDELLIDIYVPPLPRGGSAAYASFEHPASGYSLAAAAAVVKLSRRTITGCVVAFTGVSEHAFLGQGFDQLTGTQGEPEAIDRAADAALADVTATGDIHAPAGYRLHLARVAARRAIQAAIHRR